MKKIEKITIKLVMLLMFFSLLFPVRTFGAEKNEVTEKKQIIFLLDASKSMQGAVSYTHLDVYKRQMECIKAHIFVATEYEEPIQRKEMRMECSQS